MEREALRSDKVEKIQQAAAEAHAAIKEEMGEKEFFMNAKQFGVLRYLAFCMWDEADENGWVFFGKERLISKINHEDRDIFDQLEERKLLENEGTGLQPMIKLTELGWKVLAVVSHFMQERNHGWRRRKNPSTIVFNTEEMAVKDLA